MKTILVLFLALVSSVAFAAPAAIRLDYFHTGNADTELFSIDEFVVEPLPWAGNLARSVDDTNLGKYLFEVIDRATNRVLYSRGFASVYGEWETTDEARKINRTFHESFRFPDPGKAAQIVLKKRDSRNAFREIWSILYEPDDMFIDRAKRAEKYELIELQKSGDPGSKVDFLILGDGYTAAERPKFEKDARRLMAILFSTSPFRERRTDFNVWGLSPPSAESGISRPSTGIYRQTPVGTTYDAFGSERYILTFENKAFREIAAHAPYEVVEILTNTNTYGGGGIFGQYSTVAADSEWSPYVFIHEFGHHFAGLADEYYMSDVAYLDPEEKLEPWEANATALQDPENLKWKDLVEPGTPIPTPWSKEEMEQHASEIRKKRREIRAANRPESEMDALFKQQLKFETQLLSSDKYAGKVGAFEGANYQAKGYYRPQIDCIMFTRNEVPFCAVCSRALDQIIDLYTTK